MPREFDFISWIRSQQRPRDSVVVPSGDDLAVLKWEPDDLLLVGVDQVLDGVHFDAKVHPPRDIGRKVMNRNLSDCAAMACLPAAAVATVALPRGTDLEFSKALYLGVHDAGERFGCPVVGGDVATWEGKLMLTLTILGRSAGVKPIARSGAHAGDRIFVTGPLGGSILGRHMNFAPRIVEARTLARTGMITSMIDISDGLSRDLGHLCEESRVGAVIDAARVPIHQDAHDSRGDGRTPLERALHDGEDHELLFTCSTHAEPLLERILAEQTGDVLDLIEIGQITAEPGMFLLDARGEKSPLVVQGWEHTF
jgi:thiamine-monophosphate kinase